MIDPRAFNRPDRTILSPGSVDALGLALIALTRELWVVKHRQAVLETVLAEADIDVTTRIDAIALDDATVARLDREGQCLVDSVIGALTGSTRVNPNAA